jgi:hypothetical protein
MGVGERGQQQGSIQPLWQGTSPHRLGRGRREEAPYSLPRLNSCPGASYGSNWGTPIVSGAAFPMHLRAPCETRGAAPRKAVAADWENQPTRQPAFLSRTVRGMGVLGELPPEVGGQTDRGPVRLE